MRWARQWPKQRQIVAYCKRNKDLKLLKGNAKETHMQRSYNIDSSKRIDS